VAIRVEFVKSRLDIPQLISNALILMDPSSGWRTVPADVRVDLGNPGRCLQVNVNSVDVLEEVLPGPIMGYDSIGWNALATTRCGGPRHKNPIELKVNLLPLQKVNCKCVTKLIVEFVFLQVNQVSLATEPLQSSLDRWPRVSGIIISVPELEVAPLGGPLQVAILTIDLAGDIVGNTANRAVKDTETLCPLR
jgi:hypothetical protein